MATAYVNNMTAWKNVQRPEEK